MTDTEFLLKISIHYQADKCWEKRKFQLRDHQLIQYQILHPNIIRIVCQTVRMISVQTTMNEILRVKEGSKLNSFESSLNHIGSLQNKQDG